MLSDNKIRIRNITILLSGTLTIMAAATLSPALPARGLAWQDGPDVTDPQPEQLEKVVERHKEHKLTIRPVPMDAAPVDGECIFTGAPATERVLLAKAY